MNTKFMSLDNNKKVVKETVFTSFINSYLKNQEAGNEPSAFKNVLHIGFDEVYKDVFKVWNDSENDFTIYFGTKGDEFNK